MSYNDFWFIETRNQKVNIRRWFLWTILLIAFTTIGAHICIKTMYVPIPAFEVHSDILPVKIEEAKTTKVNGYIKGYVQNVLEEEISGKYMKFDLYNKEDELKGTEYIEIGTIQPGERKNYEMQYNYKNIEKFILTIVNNKEE